MDCCAREGNEAPMQVRIQYFAVLREQAGVAEELVETSAATPADLYDEVRQARGLLHRDLL